MFCIFKKDKFIKQIIEENKKLKEKNIKLESLNKEFLDKNKELMIILKKREVELAQVVNEYNKSIGNIKELINITKEENKKYKELFKKFLGELNK